MIRRLGVLFSLLLILSSCAGAEREAVRVGDQSINREDFYGYGQLVSELGSTFDLQNPEIRDGDEARSLAASAVNVFAQIQALEDVAGTPLFTDGDRLAAAQEVKRVIDGQRQALANGQRVAPISEFVTGYSPSSPGYDYVIDLVSLGFYVENNPGVVEQVRTQALIDLVQDAEVDRRIGVWDPTTGLVYASEQARDAAAAG